MRAIVDLLTKPYIYSFRIRTGGCGGQPGRAGEVRASGVWPHAILFRRVSGYVQSQTVCVELILPMSLINVNESDSDNHARLIYTYISVARMDDYITTHPYYKHRFYICL